MQKHLEPIALCLLSLSALMLLITWSKGYSACKGIQQSAKIVIGQ